MEFKLHKIRVRDVLQGYEDKGTGCVASLIGVWLHLELAIVMG